MVTRSKGRGQKRGGGVLLVKIGNVVWNAPSVQHWHGAALGAAMTQVAVGAPGKVTWMEAMTDARYRAPPPNRSRR